jgi:hypothetical protein
MSARQKFAVIAITLVAILFLGWGAVLASIQSAGGMAYVSIDPGADGPRLHFAVPMAAIEGAVTAGRAAAAHVQVDGRDLHRLQDRLGEWGPLVVAVMDVLADSPDATFVEVVDHGTHVSVVKRNGQLVVDVQDGREAYQVSLPARSAARTVRWLVG